MILFRTLTTILLSMLIMLQSSLAVAADSTLSIANQTRFDILSIYIRHNDSVKWGEDRLGQHTLDHIEDIQIPLKGYPSPIFDVKVIDRSRREYTFFGVDASLESLTVTQDDLDNPHIPRSFGGFIYITNRTGIDIERLFVRNEYASNWGINLLRNEFADGKRIRLDRYDYPSPLFDVLADVGAEFLIQDVDITAGDVTLTLGHLKRRPSVSGGGRYIQVINVSGSDVQQLYIQHEDTTDWGPELLGNDILEGGDNFWINLPSTGTSIFNIKAIDTASDVYTAFGIDADVDNLYLTRGYVKKQPSADSSRHIEVFNLTGHDVHQLYVQHEDKEEWGQNVLGSDALTNGDVYRIDLPNTPTSIFNIKAIDQNSSVYPVLGVDVDAENLNLTLDHLDKTTAPNGLFSGYIEITNRTGRDLDHLYVSHADDADWGANALDGDILLQGNMVRVDRNEHPSSIFDVRASSGSEDYIVGDIDINSSDLILTREHLANRSTTYSGYIEITNRTGSDIDYLYISHLDDVNWGSNILGNGILADGDSVRVDRNDDPRSVFDVRAGSGSDDYIVVDIDIHSNDLTLTREHLANRSTAYSGYIEITNRTGSDIDYLYVSHEDDTTWGSNILGSDILVDGDSIRVNRDHYPTSIFDIKAIADEDYIVRNTDISSKELILTHEHIKQRPTAEDTR